MVHKFQFRALDVRDSFSYTNGQPDLQIAPTNNLDHRDTNLITRFCGACEQYKDRFAVSEHDCRLTYGQLQQLVENWSQKLLALPEYRPGIHIGLHMANSIRYVIAFYGTIKAGGIAVPLPGFYHGKKLEQLCHIANVKWVIDSGEISPRSASPLGQRRIEYWVVTDQPTRSTHQIQLSTAPMAMMMFTSGSMAEPKAVMLSHRNLLANCDSICQYLPIDHEERGGVLVPLTHALGNSVMQTHLLSGGELVICPETQFPSQQINAVLAAKCSSVTGVPETFEGWRTTLLGTETEFPNLKYLAIAGGRMIPQRAQEIQARIYPAEVYLMYGQTEATARLAYLPPRDVACCSETIGQPIPGVELRVLDETGTLEMEMGQVGILFARGDNVMMGYWNDRAASEQVLVNGWLRTGDLARLRADGRIELCGRQTELVKIQGYRFHPSEIEQILNEEIDVPVAVVPFDFFGRTRLALYAQGSSERGLTIQTLSRFCRDLLPPHMVPQRYKLVSDWPLNAAGKVDRRALASSLATTNQNTLEPSTRMRRMVEAEGSPSCTV